MYSLGTYKISILPKKALRTMNFAPFNTHTTLLFKNCNILKLVELYYHLIDLNQDLEVIRTTLKNKNFDKFC